MVFAQELYEKIKRGDLRALARAITHLENRTSLSKELTDLAMTKNRVVPIVGITGPPGAGKSTLIDQLIKHYRRERSAKVGIIAVDPSSPYSKGAILGDRIRMLGSDEDIYIRSLATRGHLGGVNSTAFEVINLYRACNFDIIILETVGAGQNEVEIMNLCHTVLLLITPGFGDSIQTLKAGIFEIADIYVINKTDNKGAEQVKFLIKKMLGLNIKALDWKPPVVLTIATTGEGISELCCKIQRHHDYLKQNHGFESQERTKLQNVLQERVISNLKNKLHSKLEKSLQFQAIIDELMSGKITFSVALHKTMAIGAINYE